MKWEQRLIRSIRSSDQINTRFNMPCSAMLLIPYTNLLLLYLVTTEAVEFRE